MKPGKRQRYLEITYSRGKPFAAYLCLPRHPGDTVAKSREVGESLVADYASDGRVIGLEIVDPGALQPEQILAALATLGVKDVTSEELRPLIAA